MIEFIICSWQGSRMSWWKEFVYIYRSIDALQRRLRSTKNLGMCVANMTISMTVRHWSWQWAWLCPCLEPLVRGSSSTARSGPSHPESVYILQITVNQKYTVLCSQNMLRDHRKEDQKNVVLVESHQVHIKSTHVQGQQPPFCPLVRLSSQNLLRWYSWTQHVVFLSKNNHYFLYKAIQSYKIFMEDLRTGSRLK